MEKFNPEVLDKIVKNIETKITDCHTPDLPMYTNTCYYCISTKHECDICEYGKKYGICERDDSVWRKARKLADRLEYNYNTSIQRYYDICKRYIKLFKDCKSINEVMKVKQSFIIDVAYHIYFGDNKLWEFVNFVNSEYWNDEVECITITKDDLKPEVKNKLEKNGVFEKYSDVIRQYQYHVGEIVDDSEKSIPFGTRIKITRANGHALNFPDMFILCQSHYDRISLICLKTGNRWRDYTDAPDIIFAGSNSGIYKKILDKMVGEDNEYEIIN